MKEPIVPNVWRVAAWKKGKCLGTTYVRAPSSERAERAGRHLLRWLHGARGRCEIYVSAARPTELGMKRRQHHGARH